ncbi:MAG: DUF5060 domain-containing protein [Bacteroidales bacterium]|jgi:hypothetical protein|nr:DUF5060 domain-containing protein [Bacteroidales bacterium]
MKTASKLLILIFFLPLIACGRTENNSITGDLLTWHKVTLEITGPTVTEQSYPNPFLDYRLEVKFTNGESSFIVPGYFAADGNAGETGAATGNIWKVHFSPDKVGTWEYEISFKTGKNLAISENMEEGEAVSLDGLKDSFVVEESDKTGNDFRGKGRLVNTGDHYLMHAGSGQVFLKGGADSPENFLGYRDFDGTYYGGNNQGRAGEDIPNAGLHAYEPHVKDWTEGDPSWQNGKGKGMIGGLNYLGSKGVNSVYFLTLNILGDGEDVWPYTDRNERYRFDCSKLDQWELVFSHMEKLGIMMHVVLQETENEQILDGGYLDVQRKLYLRELIARFSHHNAITWNLGEEHGPVEWMDAYAQSVNDTKKMADYIRKVDPYKQMIVVHTNPNPENRSEYLSNNLGQESLDGLSIQAGNPKDSHLSTLKWVNDSEASGDPWVVCIDEIGQHWKGALPDAVDPAHDTIRKYVLWGNLMAGGAGVEWYFGYKYVHADLNCEDWSSRDILWDQTRIAREFFLNNLPLQEMKNMDHLVKNAYCLAKENEVYAVYYLGEGISKIDLSKTKGNYNVQWYNPRKGGDLFDGTIKKVQGGRWVDPGQPDGTLDTDWACILRKV